MGLYLSKNLNVPLPSTVTEAIGIFQSDIIIRTAIIAAIADMRENPWLLDYAFSSLAKDKLTLSKYGEKEIAEAKKWFDRVDIVVMLGVRVADGAPPPVCVTIHLQESSEVEQTLGDVHHDPYEDMQSTVRPLTETFTPVKYDAITGQMTVPDSISNKLIFSTLMQVVTSAGVMYPIVDVIADNIIALPKGTVANFSNCFVQPAIAPYTTSLESTNFRETFGIGCHCVAEPVHLTYLHSIIVFALLRYRQALLEARGFERSSITSSDFKAEDVVDMPEMYFSRYISLNGYSKAVWPKFVSEKILSLASRVVIDGVDKVPLELGQTTDDLAWIGEQDSLGGF
ncbi:hypothetical protein UFOVP75_66 [uncultured Caudovirales phage]|uniref:Uncharacterized protein n=1 Tax=uncultured Caudovirales phage TaxID=2100421 RepID=A0A6J5L1L6_9CAUD|nr:hypothetical protein UFOVP75_66 [uncultured Caudovirales phage]